MIKRDLHIKADLLDLLISKLHYRSYLEIGLDALFNWNKIECETKIGVDPIGGKPYTMTSDEFFKINTMNFDLILIDGLHEAQQVTRDIENSLRCLNAGGCIVVHDCNPEEEYLQEPISSGGLWTGDVWKAWVKMRREYPQLNSYVVNIDYGCGVIEYGNKTKSQEANTDDLNWEHLCKYRKELLNLIEPAEFLNNLALRCEPRSGRIAPL